MKMIIIMMMMLSTMMMLSNHPLSMGLMLIVQTMLMSMLTGMIMKTFLMSYILLITMLSGMLVLFIYMSSIASNEKFLLKTNPTILIMLPLTFLFLNNKMMEKNYCLSMEMMSSKLNSMFYLNKMFNMDTFIVVILMVMYLFLSMIMSTMLVNIFEGPMNMKNK
uniref:NADH dehydrogenase subunit 6 n=1 Tax=Isometopus sp. TaxID=2931297 RepID=A0A8T9ZZW6_9HEMI|nr:NADH dehydrogenase subunit 6 [Isometopus sp.]